MIDQLLVWPSLRKPLIIMTILQCPLSFMGWTSEVITYLINQVSGKVTCLLLLHYWPRVQVDTGLTNDHSSNYRKCVWIVPMDRVQTYGNIQTVAGPVVKS